MSINASQPEKQEREIIKAGTHIAYLYRVIYLGTQKTTFEGKEKQQQKIWVDFELPKEVVEYEDKETKEKKSFVRTVGEEYTLSLSEKGKLLPFIQGWLGRSLTADELQSFDVCSLLGRPAFLSIVHNAAKNGNVYANIGSVSPVMEGIELPKMVHDVVEIGKEQWKGELFNSLPEFLKKKIQESNEFNIGNVAPAKPTSYDDIPTIQLDDEEKFMTEHQGDNMSDSNNPEEVRIEDLPF